MGDTLMEISVMVAEVRGPQDIILGWNDFQLLAGVINLRKNTVILMNTTYNTSPTIGTVTISEEEDHRVNTLQVTVARAESRTHALIILLDDGEQTMVDT